MIPTDHDLFDAVLAWLYATVPGLHDPDVPADGSVPAQVWFMDGNTARPAEPCVGVKVTVMDRRDQGEDAPIQITDPDTDELQEVVWCPRSAEVEIIAYGRGAATWLPQASAKLYATSTVEALAAVPFDFRPVGSVVDVGALQGTKRGGMWSLEVGATYQYLTAPDSVVEATTTRVDTTAEGDEPLAATVTINLEADA